MSEYEASTSAVAYSKEEFLAVLLASCEILSVEGYPSTLLYDTALMTFRKWIARGDGAAVYTCRAMDSIAFGAHIFCSFGSDNSQIPTSQGEDGMWQAPPAILPVENVLIHWSYYLAGTFTGSEL